MWKHLLQTPDRLELIQMHKLADPLTAEGWNLGKPPLGAGVRSGKGRLRRLQQSWCMADYEKHRGGSLSEKGIGLVQWNSIVYLSTSYRTRAGASAVVKRSGISITIFGRYSVGFWEWCLSSWKRPMNAGKRKLFENYRIRQTVFQTLQRKELERRKPMWHCLGAQRAWITWECNHWRRPALRIGWSVLKSGLLSFRRMCWERWFHLPPTVEFLNTYKAQTAESKTMGGRTDMGIIKFTEKANHLLLSRLQGTGKVQEEYYFWKDWYGTVLKNVFILQTSG